MNVPNFLTVIRFLLIPFFGYSLMTGSYTMAVILFLLGGLTDVLDGYIARRFDMITSWGKLADPLADKLMQITALVLLAIRQSIPVAVLVIVAAKELLIGLGIIMLYKKDNIVGSANWYGKVATVLFYFAIILAIFNEKPYSDIFIAIAVIVTLFALVMYVIKFMRIRKTAKDPA